jgi:hypothetical protein
VTLLAGWAVFAISLAGCGGSADYEATETPAARAAQPTATPQPRQALSPDWRRLETSAVTIALPPQYVGGDAADDGTLEAVRSLGGACAAFADSVEPFRADYDVVAVDGGTCAAATPRTVAVQAAPSATIAASEFAEEFVRGLPAGAALVQLREGSVGGGVAALMHIRRTADTGVIEQAVTAVRAERSWYIVVGGTTEADFVSASAVFDQIAATLVVK